MNDNDKILLTVDDVAAMLSMGKSTVWKLLKKGQFPPPTKLSTRTTRWSKQTVLEFFAAKNPTTPSTHA
jgi:predicted DNA-binding transcriptional regulator AlpA